MAGGNIGQRLGPRLGEQQLRQGFALLLILSASLSGVEAWRRQQRSSPALERAALEAWPLLARQAPCLLIKDAAPLSDSSTRPGRSPWLHRRPPETRTPETPPAW
jgi:hypothetical protein